MNPDSKNIVKSKTFWTNLIVAGAYPFLPEYLKKPEFIMYALILANIILRKLSHGKVELI